MNTNWADAAVVMLGCSTLIAMSSIAAFLVVRGHPLFAVAILIIAASLSIKTGVKI